MSMSGAGGGDASFFTISDSFSAVLRGPTVELGSVLAIFSGTTVVDVGCFLLGGSGSSLHRGAGGGLGEGDGGVGGGASV